MELVFVCNRGEDDFIIEAVSGGISSIIDLAWQIYMCSTQENSEFTVLIDEAEKHLHPAMQRRLLSDFLSALRIPCHSGRLAVESPAGKDVTPPTRGGSLSAGPVHERPVRVTDKCLHE